MAATAAFVEELYARWAGDPGSVEPSWRAFFGALRDRADEVPGRCSAVLDRQSGAPRAAGLALGARRHVAGGGSQTGQGHRRGPSRRPAEAVRARTLDSLRAIMMIRAYRMRGHLAANLDPLGLAVTKRRRLRTRSGHLRLCRGDYDRPIFLDFVLGLETSTIREILVDPAAHLLRQPSAVQYMHISDPAEKAWLQQRIEGKDKEITFTREGKIAILKKLIEAEGFERFLHKRFPGTKRFGLDGGEALVPAMEQIIKRGGSLGVRDIVLGMPHRGRLNVLAAVMGKPYHVIFHEFQGGSSLPSDIEGSGDVKYHLGASSDRAFDGNSVHLSLTANPSHLEIVNPVVLGKARAKQAFTLRENPTPGAAMCCRCCCTATRPSPARAWSPNASP